MAIAKQNKHSNDLTSNLVRDRSRSKLANKPQTATAALARTKPTSGKRRGEGPAAGKESKSQPSVEHTIEQAETAQSSLTPFRDGSKGAAIVDLLNKQEGATLAAMMEATGWQAHSVRGFLSGTLKKKLGIVVSSMKQQDGERRYSIAS